MTVVPCCVFRRCPQTSPATTRTIGLVCPKCGIIRNSGVASCCGRGGSWFEKCGTAAKVKLPYRWSDGLLACKQRPHFKEIVGDQLHGEEGQRNHYSDNEGSRGHSQAVIAAPDSFTFALANMPTPMLDNMSVTKPSDVSTNASINISTIASSQTSLQSPIPMANLADTITSGATTAGITAMISSYSNASTPAPTAPSVNASTSTVATALMTTPSTDILATVLAHDTASTSITMQIYGLSCVWSMLLRKYFSD